MNSTSHNKVKLFAATSGYRILRLSLELFLLAHTIESGYSMSMAGTFFAVYSICDILSGSIYLWFPSLFLGSVPRGFVYFISTVGAQVCGFICFFSTQRLGLMMASIALCGLGTSAWFVNYQTLINIAFPKDELKNAASIRQAFEAIGFLIPSICLAIVTSATGKDNHHHAFRLSAIILGAIGACFFLASCPDVIKLASTGNTTTDQYKGDSSSSLIGNENEHKGFFRAAREFAQSSALRFFFVNSILLAMSNILGGTMVILTTDYFRLQSTDLWIGAIGIPLGGLVSAISALFIGRMKNGFRFYTSSALLLAIFAILLSLSSEAVQFDSRPVRASTCLFFFGFGVGFFFSEMWTVAFTFWLENLKDKSHAFINRANSFHNAGVQVILALVFKLQTLSLNAVDESTTMGSNTKHFVTAVVLFGFLILLTISCVMLVASRPSLVDLTKFNWSLKWRSLSSLVISFVASLTGATVEDLAFGKFSDFRTRGLCQLLKDDSVSDGNVPRANRQLSKEGLEEFLQELMHRNKNFKDDFHVTDRAMLERVIFGNGDAYTERLRVINSASSSIFLSTWSLENGHSSVQIAQSLIAKHKAGVNVRVILDGVNFYYLCLLQNIAQSDQDPLLPIKMLLEVGIPVRILTNDIGDEAGTYTPNYSCGSHRKILLVDDNTMITGGRNLSDSYLQDKQSNKDSMEDNQAISFLDMDVVLRGNFTLTRFKDELWRLGKDINDVLNTPLTSTKRRTRSLRKKMLRRSSMSLRSSFLVEDNIPCDMSTTHTADEVCSEDLVDIECGPEEKETDTMCNVEAMITLNHYAGNIDGLDCIYSSLLYLIDTAQTEIDLVYGYFQLFPQLEESVRAAVKRGVTVRVFTNADDTNDLYFFANIFYQAKATLLEIGVEVYELNSSPDDKPACAHHKFCMVDRNVVLLGSWNCIGTSIFYDSETAVVLFGDEESTFGLCQPFHTYIAKSLDTGRFTRVEEVQVPAPLHFLFKCFISKEAIDQSRRGF